MVGTPLHPIEQFDRSYTACCLLPPYHDGDARTMLDALAGSGRRIRDSLRRHDALQLAATASCQDRVSCIRRPLWQYIPSYCTLDLLTSLAAKEEAWQPKKLHSCSNGACGGTAVVGSCRAVHDTAV